LTTSTAYRKVKEQSEPNSLNRKIELIRRGRRGKCHWLGIIF